jgi:hypothetical protein
MVQSVRDLFNSGLASQARRGDSLGIWTFNEEVYTGLLPLQQLSPENLKSVEDRVAGFLRTQKFEKLASLDRLVPALDRVVRASAFISIVMVCTGDAEIHGTPFDARINEFFRSWRRQQQEAAAPFVVALRAQGGKYADCCMNQTPWPTELPALPKELFIPVAKPLASEPKKPASSVPPLIVSGKKKNPGSSVKSSEMPTNSVPVSSSNSPIAPQPGPATITSQENSKSRIPAIPDSTSASVPPVAEVGNAPASTLAQSQPATLAPVPAAALQPTASVPDTSSSTLQTSTSLSSGSPKPYSNSPAVEVATLPDRSGVSSAILGVAGATLVAIAGFTAFWMWRRRARPAREVSLITESIHRKKN